MAASAAIVFKTSEIFMSKREVQKNNKILKSTQTLILYAFFFLSWLSFTDTDSSQDSRGGKGTIFIPL